MICDDGRIIDAVTDTFWRGGFSETSISNLSAASGASRASLYKLYGDKHALLAAALDRYAARVAARVGEILAQTSDPVQAVAAMLHASADRMMDPHRPDGCLRCRSTLELRGHTAEVDAALDRVNSDYVRNMRRLLNADGKGREADAATARVLAAAVGGMVTLAEAGASRADLQDVIGGALEVVRARL
ncbi:MAG: TetR/AcrR family transcriptional regulator [Pseudomonadota bacterium]